MIINGLGFTNRRLYLTHQFFANKPIDRLLGADISAEHFDDTALGKALDEISSYGSSRLFGELAFDIAIEKQCDKLVEKSDSVSILQILSDQV